MTTLGGNSSMTTLGGNSSMTTLGGGGSSGGNGGSMTTLGGNSSMTTLGGGGSSGGNGGSMTTLGGNSSMTTLGGNSSMTTLGGGGSSGGNGGSITTLGGNSSMTTLGGGGSSGGNGGSMTTLGGNSSMTTLGGGGSSGGNGGSMTTLGGNSSMTTLGGGGSSNGNGGGMTTLGGNSSMTTLGGGGSSSGNEGSMTTLGGNGGSTTMTTTGGNSSMTTLGGGSTSGENGGSTTMTTVGNNSMTTGGHGIGIVGGSDGKTVTLTIIVSSLAPDVALLSQKAGEKTELKKESILQLTVTGSKFEFTASSKTTGKPLKINGEDTISFTEKAPDTIIVHEDGQDWQTWSQNILDFAASHHKTSMKPDAAVKLQPPTLFGKLNFKNQAKKEVKIYELSGIGEPTVLAPNYVSTFFVKSSRPSATFKAEDPNTHEEYLLNGKNLFKINLRQTPTIEDDIVITEDMSAKRTPEKSNGLCTEQPADRGPCFSALQHEVQMEAAEGDKLKSGSCKRYLEELLNKCGWRNTTYTSSDCHSFCNGNDDKDVCNRVWEWDPQKCTSAMTRYYYSPTAASNCISMDFGGCLGNANNFPTPDSCSRECSTPAANAGDTKRVARNTYEKRMKEMINKNRFIKTLSQLYK